MTSTGCGFGSAILFCADTRAQLPLRLVPRPQNMQNRQKLPFLPFLLTFRYILLLRPYYVRNSAGRMCKGLPTLLKNDGEILEAKQKMYASFCPSRGLGYMTVPQMLETMDENDLFDMFSVFSNVVHILRVIPDTLWSVE